MIKKISDKLTRKKGQTSVEYILIIGVVVGVIVLFGKQFRERIVGVTNSLFGGVETAIGESTKP